MHQVTFGVGVAPLDASLNSFSFGVPLNADYTIFFHRLFGWRVVDGTWLFTTARGLQQQLTQDFNVLPTVFRNIEWAVHTGATWEPALISDGNTELRGGLTLGTGVLGYRQGTTAEQRTVEEHGIAPCLALSAELLWMLVGSQSIGGLGVRLSLSERLGVGSAGPIHLLTLNLALVGTAGGAR
jgi:hypothetical protein